MAMPAAAVHAASYYMFLNVGSAWKGKPNPMFPAASCGRIGTGQQDCKTEHTRVTKGAGIFSHKQY
jgi:hypothetical protein